MKIITVTNKLGRTFNVRKVNQGENYGLNDCLTHDKKDPLIEFFDDKHKGKFGELGQFVARYYESTLKAFDSQNGLTLDMGVDVWKVSADNIEEVRKELFT